MKTLTWLAACAIAGDMAAGPVHAQPSTTPAAAATATLTLSTVTQSTTSISLSLALDAAWTRAVAARESEGLRRRAEADVAVARSAWAGPPSLLLSHRDDRLSGNAGRRESEIGVSVPLWLPGQRAARAYTAERAAAQAQATEVLARLRLAGELREAAWQIAATRAEATQAEAQAKALVQLADDVARRVRAGDLARADSLAAQSEVLAVSALRVNIDQRHQAARARWQLLTGQAALPDPDLPVGNKTDEAVSLPHPELLLASQSTELARQRLELLRVSRGDQPDLSVGVRQDVAGRGQGSQSSLLISLRMPFATDSRNRPLETAALTELELAQATELRLRERLDSDIDTARAAWRAAQGQLDSEATRAKLLRERATLIDKSFRAGETPLPDLLRALAAAAQAESEVARQTAALGLAHARLQQALGLFP